jgi:hypothetical protein
MVTVHLDLTPSELPPRGRTTQDVLVDTGAEERKIGVTIEGVVDDNSRLVPSNSISGAESMCLPR